jgi:hypothetical protein
VALFVGVAETKDVSMVAATLQPMPVMPVAAWRIFGGGSGETFLGERSEMSAWRRVVIIDICFPDGGREFIEMGTPPRRPPYAVCCRGVFMAF